MWDLVSQPAVELKTPALGAWSLNHWTTTEVYYLSEENVQMANKHGKACSCH